LNKKDLMMSFLLAGIVISIFYGGVLFVDSVTKHSLYSGPVTAPPNEIKSTIQNNSTVVRFQFILFDKHIPSSYQQHLGNNYWDGSSYITSKDGNEVIGGMKFADNQTGKLVLLENPSASDITFTNSSDIWFSDELVDRYIVNSTETIDHEINPHIIKEVTIKNSDGSMSNWFKLDSHAFYNNNKLMDNNYDIPPIMLIYIFYNDSVLDVKVKECTNLSNQILNHQTGWDYASAKFSVMCSQSDIFNGDWN